MLTSHNQIDNISISSFRWASIIYSFVCMREVFVKCFLFSQPTYQIIAILNSIQYINYYFFNQYQKASMLNSNFVLLQFQIKTEKSRSYDFFTHYWHEYCRIQDNVWRSCEIKQNHGIFLSCQLLIYSSGQTHMTDKIACNYHDLSMTCFQIFTCWLSLYVIVMSCSQHSTAIRKLQCPYLVLRSSSCKLVPGIVSIILVSDCIWSPYCTDK